VKLISTDLDSIVDGFEKLSPQLVKDNPDYRLILSYGFLIGRRRGLDQSIESVRLTLLKNKVEVEKDEER
jgi:hypothetical protein